MLNKIVLKRISFLTIILFQLSYFVSAFYSSRDDIKIIFIFLLLSFSLVLGYKLAYKNIDQSSKTDLNELAITVIFSTLGALLTYYLNIELKFGPAIASSLVGLVSAVFIKQLKNEKFNNIPVIIYMGSFVGMSSSLIMKNYYYIAFAGFITGLLFVITKNIFKGYGGKLGTLAFIGVIISAFIFRLIA